MKHKEQVHKRVRKAGYHWDTHQRCLLCGRNWTHACDSHSAADNLAMLLYFRELDGVQPNDSV